MIDLSEYDSAFATPTPLADPIPTASVIPNGLFTITFPCGSHRTFRIFTKRPDAKFAAGKRVVAMLIGPDNASFSDYEPFAFCDDTGIHVWKRFKNQRQAEYARLLWMLATGCEADGHTLLVSKRCLRCNRTLSTPDSLAAGIGPECLEKLSG